MNILDMLPYADMLATIDERKVGRHEVRNDEEELILVVDTCLVTDSDKPYETAVSDIRYNPGHWSIVEAYDTPEEAREGHEHWVTMMTGDDLPDSLRDITTCAAAKERDRVEGTQWREQYKKEEQRG